MTTTRFAGRYLVAIAVGGVGGAALRWSIVRPSTSRVAGVDTLPWETLTVNGLGCLILGVTTALLTRSRGPRLLLLAIGTGFCGSLTTFSTFALEVAAFMHPQVNKGQEIGFTAQQASERGTAITYLLLSVVVGFVAFALGRLGALAVDRSPT